MNQVKGYQVTEEILKHWEEKFVPTHDIFFFKENPSFFKADHFTRARANEISLDEKTAFLTWRVAGNANYVVKISNQDFHKLDEGLRQFILKEQLDLGRGMIFRESELSPLLNVLNKKDQTEFQTKLQETSFYDEASQENIYLLQGQAFRSLSSRIKATLLMAYANEWVSDYAFCNELSKGEVSELSKRNPIIAPYFDRFPVANGSNCLAAAITGATGNFEYIHEWMKEDRFLDLLQTEDYEMIKDKNIQEADVIVWKNQDGLPMHASYMLTEKLSFNKHGQTMFNPWQVLWIEDVMQEWNQDEFYVYRKLSKKPS
ncbi:hypothetical protein [Pontibacillus marinus]|uniref:Uncharacterized protein n=1 Tax=Pontibacillus marinus BH030004 = DSM 16465 TaxID=1385511 RepID=A0A0A5HXJ2_9BACI|nr:hypothetical protein [Pontibacillus marinus]KGX88337.1 hypothetical protein N783_08690 [Pontibacillus marinus BH030004 = DSM 16465]